MRDRGIGLVVALALLIGAPSALASTGPALSVDATSADTHPISPGIYGLNFADPTFASQIALPVDRWGGNATDTYNWQLGSSNQGSDYYFENASDCWDAAHNWCGGLPTNNVFAYRDFVAKDRSVGASSLITLPMTGYVAKDAPVSQPLTCGYPKSQYPTQDSFDPYNPVCGNGHNGGNVIPGVPSNDGTQVSAPFSAAWIADLESRYGSAASGGVKLYELGNEPSLWSSTHSNIHPAAETASELWTKSRDYATAVKTADPGAQVLGFSEWGWPAYFCTGADTPGNGCDATSCTTSPDCANHGNEPMWQWLLSQFANYDASTGVRHLDYLDLHYYAQGGNTPDVTRSLWDPTYTDPSWIADKIDLIPRMKSWVAGYYPGTKLSLSEYNLSLSGVGDVTNALIQADALGIFGREGLDLATRWPLGVDGTLINDAYLMYRNYDGNHSTFGDTSVHSTSADQSQLSIYGARRSADGAYTVMVINKTSGPLTSALSLAGIALPSSAQTWGWTGGAISALAGTPIQSGAITATYPANSITLYVIKPTSPTPTPTPTPPVVGAPALTGLRLQPQKFSLKGRRVNGRCVKPTRHNRGHASCRRTLKLRVAFTLSRAASVTIVLERSGRGGKLVALPRTVTRAGLAGTNRVMLARKLRRGTYMLVATPTGGSVSAVAFVISR